MRGRRAQGGNGIGRFCGELRLVAAAQPYARAIAGANSLQARLVAKLDDHSPSTLGWVGSASLGSRRRQ
jgi:hypothetical protein